MHLRSTFAVVLSLAAISTPAFAGDVDSYLGHFDGGSSLPGVHSAYTIETTGQPVIGQSITLAIDGVRTSSACVVALGFAGAYVPYFNDTVILVDLASASVLTVSVSSTGTASLTIPIPNDSGLVGLDLRAQFFTIDGNGVFRASDLAILDVGNRPGAGPVQAMTFSSTSVKLENFVPRIDSGTAIVDGFVDLDSNGQFDGDAYVTLPGSLVARVNFTPNSKRSVHIGSPETHVLVAGIEEGLDGPTIVFDGQPVTLKAVAEEMAADLESGTWGPLTQGMMALSAVFSTDAMGRNLQAGWMTSAANASECDAYIAIFAAWLQNRADDACDWLKADCQARGGRYFKWFLVDCDLLAAACELGGLIGTELIAKWLERFWTAD